MYESMKKKLTISTGFFRRNVLRTTEDIISGDYTFRPLRQKIVFQKLYISSYTEICFILMPGLISISLTLWG